MGVSTARAMHVFDDDIIPTTKALAPTKRVEVPLFGNDFGRFLRDQMVKRGYFVVVTRLRERRPIGKITNLTATRTLEGRVLKGIWATGALARRAHLNPSTLRKLMHGRHTRSPEFRSVRNVLAALGLKFIGIPIGEDEAERLVTKAW